MKLFLMGLMAVTVAYTESMVLPKNFTANFTQMVSNPKKKVINYKGKIRFSDQSMLKWSYEKPTQKEVCVTGHELSIVDHDLEQVTYMTIDKEFDFITVLKNAKLHHKNVYVSKYKETSYTIQVDASKKIQSVAFFDNLDNKVQIVFKQVKYAKGSLSKEDMVCTVPQNFDIIR
jgi:outer membrane lipoprotein carrier protein